MSSMITSDILVAYSQCPRKAFLLLFSEEEGHPQEYVQILEQERCRNREKRIDVLKQKHSCIENDYVSSKANSGDYLINTTLRSNDLEAHCEVLTKIVSESSPEDYAYAPIIFTGLQRPGREQELELFFIGHVLKALQGKPPKSGTIVDMRGISHKIKLENGSNSLDLMLEILHEWMDG